MIIFDIENKKEEYALCHSIINFCKTGINFDKIFDETTYEKIELKYIKGKLESDNYDHNKKLLKKIETSFNTNHKEPLSLFPDDEIKLITVSSSEESLSCFTSLGLNADNLKCEKFLFRVKNTNEDDCVNFIYFELIRQYYNDCFIYIIPKDVDDIFRISHFYLTENLVNNKDTYNRRYFFIGKKQVRRLNIYLKDTSSVNYASRFMPLIEINDCTYNVFSKSVKEYFKAGEFGDKLVNCEKIEKSERLEFEKQWTTDALNSKKSNDDIYTDRIRIFLVYLFSLVGEYYSKDDLSNIQYQDTSVLSFAFFLTFVFNITSKNKNDKLEIYSLRDLLFDAENFSEGVLQLLENALLYSKYSKYFCYRLHKTIDKDGHEQFEKEGIISNMGQCLEVLIADYNVCRDTSYTSIIKERFIENLHNNYIDEDIINGFKKHLMVKDFFEPSKDANEYWEKYYSKPENIVFHYGLNIFDQVVASSGGYFLMSSSNNGISSVDSYYERNPDSLKLEEQIFKNIPAIPGTVYRILLPLNKKKQADFTTGINSDLNFELIKKIETRTIIVKDIIDEINVNQKISQTNKNRLNEKNDIIKTIANLFCSEIFNDNLALSVLIFDTKDVNLPMESEKFSKALVSILAKIEEKTKRIAVVNTTDTLRSVFIRTVGTLYYKDRQRSFLKDIQIFLCDISGQKGIIFYGDEIENSIAATQFLFDERGEYLHELQKLENIKRIKGDKKTVKSNIKDIFPFDIIVKDEKDGKTIFQKKVIDDINKDITKRPFGCKLEDVHMRVGSKLHIHGAYFEASLLFSISNYVSRFAYLLAEDIVDKYNQTDRDKKLILLGYDTCSEMLMVKTVEILKDRFKVKNCDYCIYEEAAKGEKFRNLNKDSKKNAKFAVIVPVGCSLTTNQKIVKELGREVKGFNVTENILSNHCVVLIRDEKGKKNECSDIEKNFWSEFNTSLSEVTLKKESEDDLKGYNISKDNKVKIIVSVSHEWLRQDDCKYCYPVNLIKENPIIQVNKSSVIPLIKIGLSEEWNEQPKDEIELSSKSKEGGVKLLKDNIVYGHLSRDDNHFEYYLQTEKLMQHIHNNVNSEKEFDDWAKAVGKDIKISQNKILKVIANDEVVTYNFIVAPIHTTNTLFIEKINKKAINAKAIIWIDVDSEYRDNVKTKYSFLTSLFNNLTQEGRKAQINFHYVDDTISSGFHILRSKNLLHSLFIHEALLDNGYRDVKVNLFASVIILVNRISNESKRRYIENINLFFNYINLNISALRNHADACILCNKYRNYREMLTFSGTNDLAKVVVEKIGKYEIIPIDKITKESDKAHTTNANPAYSKKDGFLRLLYNHELNSEMSSKKHRQNDKDEVLAILKNKLNEIIKQEDEYDNEISVVKKIRNFLYVMGTPFFIFRKSALEASFEFLLNLTEMVILRSEKNSNFFDKSIEKFIESIEVGDEKDVLKELLKALFHRLASLGSNFVMRARVINAFFKYISVHFSQDEQSDWIEFYLLIIKQTLYFNKQDSRSLWLEKLLIDRKEPTGDNDVLIIDNKTGIDKFRCLALLENNTIIHDALQETQRVFESAYGGEINEKTPMDNLLQVFCQSGEEDEMIIQKEKWINITKDICEELNSYYCKHYREMLSDKNTSFLVNDDDPKIRTVAYITFLKVLLIPNYNLFGNQDRHDRFYRILLKTIGEVFGRCKKVRLFEKIPKTKEKEITIQFIDSSVDGEDHAIIKNVKIYENIDKLLKEESLNKTGNTIFFSEKLCVIQLINYKPSDLDKKQENANCDKLEWYLVFEMDNNVELTDEILQNARNLLVMREALVACFERDFDNHLYQKWVMLDKQVAELSIESGVSHTPYEELDREYEKMVREIEHLKLLEQKKHPDFEDLNISFAKRLFLMADSYISKWYVNKTIDHIPSEQIGDEITTVSLKRLKLFLEKAQLIKIEPDNEEAYVEFYIDDSIYAQIPEKCEPFFIMMFVELLTNAIRHGLPDQTRKKIKVTLELTADKKYLKFSNKATVDVIFRNTNDGGITCKTIKWFYEKFGFPQVCFDYESINNDSWIYYILIPIVKEIENGKIKNIVD